MYKEVYDLVNYLNYDPVSCLHLLPSASMMLHIYISVGSSW